MKEVIIVKASCFLKNSTATLLTKNPTVEVEITKDKMQKNGNERRYDTFLSSFPIEILWGVDGSEILEEFQSNSKKIMNEFQSHLVSLMGMI